MTISARKLEVMPCEAGEGVTLKGFRFIYTIT